MVQSTVWWNELRTTDEKASTYFYSKLFGWGMFQFGASDPSKPPGESEPGYTVWMSGWTQAGGMMRTVGDTPPGWLPFIAVSNVDDCARRCESLGGKVLERPFDVPNSGRFAVLQDPLGAVFGIATPLSNE
jgi:predicted enzyme related to lactoylglutathione lyase